MGTMGIVAQLMGGIATYAVQDPRTEFDFDDRIIHLPDNMTLSTIREENGSLRDADILLMNQLGDDVKGVRRMAKEVAAGRLKTGVNKFEDYSILQKRIKHPLSPGALFAAMGDRFVDVDGNRFKSIFPFGVELNAGGGMQTWQYVRGEQSVSTMDPARVIINYVTRSSGSGIREKDAKKLRAAWDGIVKYHPELRDYILEGPCSNQLELTRAVEGLKPIEDKHSATKMLGITPYKPEELTEIDAFLLKSESPDVQERVLALAALRSTITYKGESNDRIRSFVQNHGIEETWFGRILGNR